MDNLLPVISYRNYISYCKIYQEEVKRLNNKYECYESAGGNNNKGEKLYKISH